MAWRKWLVRCLVCIITCGIGAAGVVYQQWTNPAAVREQVIEHLRTYFVGAHVSLDSAQLKLLGGISFRELRLTGRENTGNVDLLHVPEGMIYPDKERLTQGTFAVRKIELHRAQLRIRRGVDGKWNFTGVLAPPDLSEHVPTIEFRRATVQLEDELAGADLPVVELTDVNVTLINDPLSTIRIEGRGVSRLAEKFEAGGTFQRSSGDTNVRLKASGIAIGPTLVQRLTAYAPELSEHLQQLTGTGSVEAALAYHATASEPWTYDLRWQLSQGNLRHPKIPVPLEDIDAVARCMDGHLTVERFAARSGAARIELTAKAKALHEDADVIGDLHVKQLPVHSDIFAQLPEGLQKINREFSPVGPIALDLHFERNKGDWIRRCTIRPEDLTATFHKFPYPLEHITGTLVQVIDDTRKRDELTVDLVGIASGQRVHVKGKIEGVAPHVAADFKVWGENITLDQKLMSALPPKHQKIAAAFHPTGRADFEARIRRESNSPEWLNRFLIRFHDTTVKYDVFPYPLENVTGVLDIESNKWEAHDFRGTHNGGAFRATARMQPTPAGDTLVAEIRGDRVSLDRDLKDSLVDPDLKHAWKVIRPGGLMNFTAQVTRIADQQADVQVTVAATKSTIRPEFFDCPLVELTGTLKYAKRWVHLENLRARHGRSVLHLDKGRIFLNPEGGIWADIASLRGEPIVLDEEMLHALPPPLRRACETVRLRDPIRLNTRLVVATTTNTNANPDIYWEGRLAVNDASLHLGVPVEHVRGEVACTGRFKAQQLEAISGNLALSEATIFQQPFRDIQSEIRVPRETPDVLVFPGLHAQLHGGQVYGPVRIEFGSRVRYELDLTASQIRLEEFGRHNLGSDAKLSGLATAKLYLVGKGPDIHELQGRGTIDVPNGRLGPPLPLLLELLKFLSIRIPDGTAFEEAHASFTLNGPRVNVERVDLFGNSISLRGKGEMNYDGTDLNMDFYAVWARVTQMLPPIIKDLPHDVSKHLLKIHAEGRLGDVRFTKEPVPILVDPLKGLLERMSGRSKRRD